MKVFTIFKFWLGVSVVAVADTFATVAGFWANVGLRLCSRARDNGYDLADRLQPRKFESETTPVNEPEEAEPLALVL